MSIFKHFPAVVEQICIRFFFPADLWRHALPRKPTPNNLTARKRMDKYHQHFECDFREMFKRICQWVWSRDRICTWGRAEAEGKWTGLRSAARGGGGLKRNSGVKRDFHEPANTAHMEYTKFSFSYVHGDKSSRAKAFLDCRCSRKESYYWGESIPNRERQKSSLRVS